MTIAISLKVNDGVVLASDSAATLLTRNPDGSPGVANIYNNADKIFQLGKKSGLPIGLITWGSGSIGVSSIATLVKDLRSAIDEDSTLHSSYTIYELAERVRHFMYDEHYVPAFGDWTEKPNLGFIVAGYSSDAAMAEEYRIDILNGECHGPIQVRKPDEVGITWNGDAEALNRLLMGYSGALPIVLHNVFGVPEQELGGVVNVLTANLATPLVVAPMPIQDAIDLAEFLVDVAIHYSRFIPGPTTVAGPIEIAAITKHEGFKWIRRKHYYRAELNPRG